MLETAKDGFSISALNLRGNVLQPMVEEVLRACAAVRDVQVSTTDQGLVILKGSVEPDLRVLSEEERSQKNSVFSVGKLDWVES